VILHALIDVAVASRLATAIYVLETIILVLRLNNELCSLGLSHNEV